jgi:hypothetical protein
MSGRLALGVNDDVGHALAVGGQDRIFDQPRTLADLPRLAAAGWGDERPDLRDPR